MTTPTLPSPVQQTRVLGCFEIERFLGEGSSANVYLARQDGTDRRAVIKIAHAELLQHPERDAIVRSFLTEFRAASAVQHPNVATVYLVGVTDDLPTIAMEFVEGPTLSSLLERYTILPANVLVRMWAQLASALDAIHDAGVVHQDISPRNIAVTRSVTTQHLVFKILDFGVSHFQTSRSWSGSNSGTPRYMAPEHYHGRPTTASDVFSLGCLIWWAATGTELRADLLTMEDVHRHFLHPSQDRPAPGPLLGTLPPKLAQLVCAMLDPTPARRPTARELVRSIPALWKEHVQENARSSQEQLTPTGHSRISMELPSIGASHPTSATSISSSLTTQPRLATSPRPAPSPAPQAAMPPTLDLSALAPLNPAQRRHTIEHFIGNMPIWLADLEEIVEHAQLDQLHAIGHRIIEGAQCVGAARLADLMLGMLHSPIHAFMTTRFTDLTQIQREYTQVFRELVAHHPHRS